MSEISNFEARLSKLMAIEDEKTTLVQDLIDRVKLLECDLSEAHRQRQRALDVADMYQAIDETKGMELMKIQQTLDQTNFVSVLIDGDCMAFVSELLTAGEHGGRQASRLLKAGVTEYLRCEQSDIPSNVKISIRVYANLKGLGRAYCDAQILGSLSELGDFMNGFNKEDPLCDFVNAGDGKECADEKLKAVFQMSFDNVQCRHIIFGGSADNGYARLLGPHVESKKITLLEGPPFAKELVYLSTRYPIMECPAVIRKTRLVARRVELDALPPRDAVPDNSVRTNYAIAASSRSMQANPGARAAANTIWNTVTSRNGNGKIARNATGHRIDTPLQCSNAEIKAMKMKKVCNEFHILGQCRYGVSCTFEHGTRVSKKAVEALRYIARLSSCHSGLRCSDPNCILGHRCPKEPCRKGDMCFFPAIMHGVDTKIVSWDG